jgi:hypothetical protein
MRRSGGEELALLARAAKLAKPSQEIRSIVCVQYMLFISLLGSIKAAGKKAQTCI